MQLKLRNLAWVLFQRQTNTLIYHEQKNWSILDFAKLYFSGQAADDDEEIESFTAENFEADVATNDEPKTETGKDEL